MHVFVTELGACKCQEVELHAEIAMLAAWAWDCTQITAVMLLFAARVGISACQCAGTAQRSAELCQVHLSQERSQRHRGQM